MRVSEILRKLRHPDHVDLPGLFVTFIPADWWSQLLLLERLITSGSVDPVAAWLKQLARRLLGVRMSNPNFVLPDLFRFCCWLPFSSGGSDSFCPFPITSSWPVDFECCSPGWCMMETRKLFSQQHHKSMTDNSVRAHQSSTSALVRELNGRHAATHFAKRNNPSGATTCWRENRPKEKKKRRAEPQRKECGLDADAERTERCPFPRQANQGKGGASLCDYTLRQTQSLGLLPSSSAPLFLSASRCVKRKMENAE